MKSTNDAAPARERHCHETAAMFVDFMVSFMVGLSITMIDRLYLGPAVDTGEELQAPFNFWFIVV